MATKGDLVDWVLEALKSASGSGTLLYVAKHIWENHEEELRASGTLFYTWQYDMRWAATELRRRSVMVSAEEDRRGKWTLK